MSSKRERWAALVNSGKADSEAARLAGYGAKYAEQASTRIRPVAESEGLLRTAKAAEVARDAMERVLSDPQEIEDVWRAILARAKAGDIAAAREILDRLLGKAHQAITMTSESDIVVRWFNGADRHD